MNKYLSGAVAGTFLLGVSCASIASVIPPVQKQSDWFTQASEVVAGKQVPVKGKAKNVILFIGDGMGISTLTTGRIREGQLKGETGEENYLGWEEWPSTALVKTYNSDSQVPDSAGTMTAIITGVKTRAGLIAVGPEAERSDCSAARKNDLVSALTLAERKGMATGVVTTARVTHATPASTYANSGDRNWEAVAPNKCDDIATQLIKYKEGNGIEVVLGGGLENFIPQDEAGSERQDNKDLVEDWLKKSKKKHVRTFVSNSAELSAVTSENSDQVLGLFNPSHMSYEYDRQQADLGGEGEPSLTEMATKAVDLLQEKGGNDGFFLTVEAGRIDHAHHDSNPFRALGEVAELSKAVKAVASKVDLDETLIIVTADHSHTLSMAGYQERGNPILGKADTDSEDNPYTTIGYVTGLGFHNGIDFSHQERVPGRQDLRTVDTELPDFRSEALIQLSSETHGGEDVALHAIGPGSALFNGLIEQNYIFHAMNEAAGLGAKDYQ